MLTLIQDKDLWQEILNRIGLYDCYHTYEYHLISIKKRESAFLLNFENKSTHIAIPLIKRPIDNTPYFDLTSVYGYAGPLISGIVTESSIAQFHKSFKDFLFQENIISIFSRLHPFLSGQNEILKGLGNIVTPGTSVYIDLNKNIEVQRAEFSKTTKRYLNKARRHYYIESGNSESDIDKFMELYFETMDRVKAKEYYYFSKDYFSKLLSTGDFQTELLFAKSLENHDTACGALFLKTKNMVQYHLSGTKEEHLRNTPLRLLIDDARIKASKEGYDYFNLGGGLGGNKDSLFQFKSSFSKDYKPFQAWEYIANEEVYQQLCDSKLQHFQKEVISNNINFFPLYRYNQ